MKKNMIEEKGYITVLENGASKGISMVVYTKNPQEYVNWLNTDEFMIQLHPDDWRLGITLEVDGKMDSKRLFSETKSTMVPDDNVKMMLKVNPSNHKEYAVWVMSGMDDLFGHCFKQMNKLGQLDRLNVWYDYK